MTYSKRVGITCGAVLALVLVSGLFLAYGDCLLPGHAPVGNAYPRFQIDNELHPSFCYAYQDYPLWDGGPVFEHAFKLDVRTAVATPRKPGESLFLCYRAYIQQYHPTNFEIGRPPRRGY